MERRKKIEEEEGERKEDSAITDRHDLYVTIYWKQNTSGQF